MKHRYTFAIILSFSFAMLSSCGSSPSTTGGDAKVINPNTGEVKTVQSADLEPGLQEAYNRLMNRGHADVVFPGYGFRESKDIGGIIESFDKNVIILNVMPVNALASPDLDKRAIRITSGTKVYIKKAKNKKEIEADMMAFDKKIKTITSAMTGGTVPDMPLPPEPYKEVEIEASKIRKGASAIIEAKSDIHALKEFEASKIVLQ